VGAAGAAVPQALPILYLLRTGCPWRYLPRDGFPPRSMVYNTFRKFQREGAWEAIWADGGYNAWQVETAVAKVPVLRVEIVKRSDDMNGFVVVPRRWVVERTFSWFGRDHRLAKDFENLAQTLAAFVTLASIQLAVRRFGRVKS
jgi:transposase